MIHLLVAVMDKAKTFYNDILGFKASQDSEYGGDRLVFIIPRAAARA
jgi:catechol 2,3-dioxygenase-like lactoylglutathione lyase family enzyme